MEIGLRELLEGLGAIIMGLLSIVWKNLSGDLKATKILAEAALPRADFIKSMTDLETGRREFREGQIKLFERIEQHAKEDTVRFETLTKDFNGAATRITDAMHENHTEILKALNGKVDK